MSDSYLQEIGKSIKLKLSRCKVTGLVNPVSFYPLDSVSTFTNSGWGYSGDAHTRVDCLKHALMLTKMNSLRKFFPRPCFSGETFFAQRHFQRVPSKAGGKTESVCNGRSTIVETE